MKKEMLSLNSWIEEATRWQQPLDDFLIDYNMRELECSEEDLLAKMQAMLAVMEKSVEHGLSGVRSHSGLTVSECAGNRKAERGHNHPHD